MRRRAAAAEHDDEQIAEIGDGDSIGPKEHEQRPLIELDKEDEDELDRLGEQDDDATIVDRYLEQLASEREWWETYVECVLWTIPFGFLYSGLDYAIHAQYDQELSREMELKRLVYAVPMIYMLNLMTYSSLSAWLLNLIMLAMHVTCGLLLIHTVNNEGYLRVMRQAPGLGTVWVWTTVRLDLKWATIALLMVASVAYIRS